MRGTCGWSVGELRLLPEKAVLPLLRLFATVGKGGCWPKQLQTWLLVLLRKEEGIPTWKSVRPISVASVVYRVWARIRTSQLLQLCHEQALPTVGPRLSTRSLWGYVANFVAEEEAAGGSPSGWCWRSSNRSMLCGDLWLPLSCFTLVCHQILYWHG